jgi:hypothetical protein
MPAATKSGTGEADGAVVSEPGAATLPTRSGPLAVTLALRAAAAILGGKGWTAQRPSRRDGAPPSEGEQRRRLELGRARMALRGGDPAAAARRRAVQRAVLGYLLTRF